MPNAIKLKTAAQVAKLLGDDGLNWETAEGEHFDALVERLGARKQYSERCGDDSYRPCYSLGHLGTYVSGDPIRYVFPDGSAIVVAGEGWDIEGDEPFSWSF